MTVRFVDLKRQYESIRGEIDQAIQKVLQDSAFIGGRYVREFEEQFAAYVGTKHCIGVGNGTDALFIALKMLGVGPGDEVITAANSFIATSEAITMTGAKVVFADCDSTYNIDPQVVERLITKRTKALVPVHLYGQPARMEELLEIARRHGLHVVEDAAQAHGARYRGRNVGTLGICACFSFFPGKNLGAYGDAGAIVTDDETLAERCRMFSNHGRLAKYEHKFEGINSRLDGLQAAVLSVKLKYLERWTERRRQVASMYDQALQGLVHIPKVMPEVRHVYHLYVIRVSNRDKVREFLSNKGIQTGIHYPVPLPFLEAYNYLNHKPQDFPRAYSYKDEILSLPMHGSITDEEVQWVIQQLKEALS